MAKKKIYLTINFFFIWSVSIFVLFILSWLFDFYLGYNIFLPVSLSILIITILVILRIVQLLYKRLEERSKDYNQLESLHSLYNHLKPSVPLPKMRNHAGSPDFLNLIVETLIIHKPQVIVEVGSGVSSLVISEWLIQNDPNAQHVALDHLEKYAQLTANRVRNPNSSILFTPLKPFSIHGKSYQWYDFNPDSLKGKIDLLIVDGPPTPRVDKARFPAIPLLYDQLAPNVTVLLDDGLRKEEREIALSWQKEYGFEIEFQDFDKGVFILKKR